MNKIKVLALSTVLAMGATQASAVVNGGFESGTTAGWTSSCTTGAATGYGAFGPTEGTFLGVAVAGCGEGVYSTLTRVFNLLAGQRLHGTVGFQANDYIPYNDDAYLSVNGNNIFTASVGSVGNFGNSGWQNFSFTALTTGAYTLQLGVTNRGDNGFSSGAVLDAVGVPEPAQWALMLGGFGLLGAASRRRRSVTVTYA